MRTTTKVIALKLSDTERDVVDALVARGLYLSRSEVFRQAFMALLERHAEYGQQRRRIESERRIHKPRGSSKNPFVINSK